MDGIAFFDLDHTLVDGDTDVSFLRLLVERGHASTAILDEVARIDAAYTHGDGDPDAYVALLRAVYGGRSPAALSGLAETHAREHVASMLFPGARGLLERERRRGRSLVLLSATNRVVSGPVARLLGLDDCVSSELAVDAGRFTGELSVFCYGPGKRDALLAYCEQRGLRPERVALYGDGRSDLEALEVVGEPVAVHPHPALAERAAARGWPVLDLSRGE